jgi:glycosyltransferase involved in cell wall biosynthesis
MPDVVLPVLDEAESLPWVLGRMPGGFNPIVVDNGSTDGSGALANRLGAQVVRETCRGFGAACFAGLNVARASVVCFMDADGSLDPRELTRVVMPILNAEADLVLGSRSAMSREAWPVHARLANRVLAFEVRRRTGVRLKDIGPMRAARREPLLKLGIVDRRFGWPLEMVFRADRMGWRILEVPVSYAARAGGRSKVSGSLRGTLRAVRDMSDVLARA